MTCGIPLEARQVHPSSKEYKEARSLKDVLAVELHLPGLFSLNKN
jgi:hypothetical protein